MLYLRRCQRHVGPLDHAGAGDRSGYGQRRCVDGEGARHADRNAGAVGGEDADRLRRDRRHTTGLRIGGGNQGQPLVSGRRADRQGGPGRQTFGRPDTAGGSCGDVRPGCRYRKFREVHLDRGLAGRGVRVFLHLSQLRRGGRLAQRQDDGAVGRIYRTDRRDFGPPDGPRPARRRRQDL